jgi:hypothetical protein
MSRRSAAFALAFSFLGAACGKTVALPANVGVAAPGAAMQLPVSALPSFKDSTPPGLEAHALLGVPDGSIGPFLARRGDVVMAAYVGLSAEGARRVVSVPLSAHGDKRIDARVVAPVASDATMLVVRPSGGPKPGFVAAWTYLTDRGEALAVVGIADDGHGRGEATELARTTDDIVWIDVVPTSRGALAIWAEQVKGGDANLVAAALGPDGAMRGLPAKVARGLKGWQIVPMADGVGLALVTDGHLSPDASSGKRDTFGKLDERGHGKGTTILWQRLDADGRANDRRRRRRPRRGPNAVRVDR